MRKSFAARFNEPSVEPVDLMTCENINLLAARVPLPGKPVYYSSRGLAATFFPCHRARLPRTPGALCRNPFLSCCLQLSVFNISCTFIYVFGARSTKCEQKQLVWKVLHQWLISNWFNTRPQQVAFTADGFESHVGESWVNSAKPVFMYVALFPKRMIKLAKLFLCVFVLI